MPLFDAKLFNGEVFQKYVDRIPNTKLNELVKSSAIRQRPDLASAMSDQVGGNYITTPLTGLISGSVPLNYDGQTDITSQSTKTFSHSRVVVGRANAWTEKDFSYDITGGVDFMENVAQQISEYWDEIDQDTIVCIMQGIFAMADPEGAKFVKKHTHDVSALTNSEGKVGLMDATTLNTAIQKACGDNKGKFSMAIMHSKVATNLENLKVLVYLKFNDANGMERELNLATLNGRLVLIDDSMPTAEVEKTAGVYTVTVGGSPATGEKYTVASGSFTVAGTQTATAVATGLAAALASDPTYTVTRDGAVLTLTEKSGQYGAGVPVTASEGVGTSVAGGTLTAATDTPAEVATSYTTYVFGDGAIEYTDCKAKVPYEMFRDPKTNGGQDTLYSRQRKCFAPYGISFTKAYMATLSPTNAELKMGANWELVNSNEAGAKEYISDKAIPIAQIISLG
jgi:hypothetical protein